MSIKKEDVKKWTLRLIGIEFFYWMASGCHNYLTVYLNANGYTPEQVSVINTILSATGILATPIGGTIADKIHSSRKAMIIILIGSIITYSLIPLSAPIMVFGLFSAALIFVVLSRAFQAPSGTLMETTVINGCNKTGSYYGFVRTWGTISYVIMNLILGRFVNDSNVNISFYLYGALMIPCVLFGFSVKEISDSASGKKKTSLKDLPYDKLFSNPYFITYIIFSIMDQIPSSCINIFQPYLIQEVGDSMGLVGYLQAYRATFEIPTLLFSNKLEKFMSYKTMVLINAVLYAFQCICYSTVQTFPQMIFATTLSGIASGFRIAGAARYIFTLAPKELQSTAQTLSGATMSISGVVGGILGRVLIAKMGLRDLYVAIGFAMGAAVVIYILMDWVLKNVLHKEFIDHTKDPDPEVK